MDSFLIHIYFSCSSNIYYLWKIETFAQYIFVVQTDTKVINIVLVVHIVLDCFGPYNVVRYSTLCTIFEGTITVEKYVSIASPSLAGMCRCPHLSYLNFPL